MEKCFLSERDICSKLIMPALISAGWNLETQILEEKTPTAGRIIVRGKKKRADYVLCLKPMALCDWLETALTADTTSRLLEAPLHEALEPAEKTLEAAE